MGSMEIPYNYMNSKDCSQGYCSVYCPQWCYILFSPPPSIKFPDESSSNPAFSPLIIAIIGILASAFLLVSYYTVISKYCGNRNRNLLISRTNESHNNPELGTNVQVSNSGLDEALINSITVCKYRKGDGLIEGTDCSVCLSEFEENESLRLLPKCNHAFHVSCIDTWLKSQSNCPLCRANIVLMPIAASSPLAATWARESHYAVHSEGIIMAMIQCEASKTPLHVFSDLRNFEEIHTIIEINQTY